MIFTGKLIAWALVVVGGLRVAMGAYIAAAFVEQEAYEAATARYIGSGTTGDAIDQGLIMIAVGVAFALLIRIASKRARATSGD